MENELKAKVAEYLRDHEKLTLATATAEGKPLTHTVEYVADGTTVYFGTMKSTRKAQNILRNPNVAYSVDEVYADWLAIRGVQMEGVATILSDGAEIDKAVKLYIRKFPFVANFPPNPNMIFVKIEPVAGFYLDYAKGFTHKDKVVF